MEIIRDFRCRSDWGLKQEHLHRCQKTHTITRSFVWGSYHPGVEEYYVYLSPTLDAATDAAEAWTSLADEQNRLDASTISREDARRMVQETLEAATTAFFSANDAVTALNQTPHLKSVKMPTLPSLSHFS